MTAGNGRFRFANGRTQDLTFKSGDVLYTVAETHMPENIGDQAFDVIEIELKGKPEQASQAATK